MRKIVLFVFFYLFVFCVGAQAADLIIYTSQPQNQMVEVIALFNKTYPDITVELYRDGTTKVLNKLQAELAAGDPKADILLIANSVGMNALKKQGVLQPYAGADVTGYDVSQYDADKCFFGTKLITTGIIYNTKAGVPAPKSWQELLKPEAKNQVIMPSPLYSGAAVIHVGTLVEQPGLGWEYYEKLADNGAVAGKGNGSVREAVARGEKAYGVIIDYMAFGAKAKGSPVDFVFPAEGVTSINQPVGILKNARHLNAAKKFIDFQLSRAAQEQAVRQNYLPLLKGVRPPAAYGDLSGLKVMTADPDVIEKKTEENKRTFADLFGGA